MMPWIIHNLWLIPALPLLAAGVSALVPQRCRRFSALLGCGSMGLSFLLSVLAFVRCLEAGHRAAVKEVCNFEWLRFAAGTTGVIKLGWVLDPLTAVMLLMVTGVSLLVFIYSVGYLAEDGNFTRFFTFLSLFAGAMLGLVIANSLLLLFICWEIVGLTSYLLIGFWYHRPDAAAAAKKAFITTRLGDLALLLGMVWLYSQTGTLIFFDGGAGCLEAGAVSGLAAQTTRIGMTLASVIGLLIFAGAAGKSAQVPLHVWLPDAMEGPTPVSALIHAATMVAAGVFLVARVYPLLSAHAVGASAQTASLQVVAWTGALTAVFGASIALTQNDLKRILAYSTVSQLGYMMMGLGVGGVAVGMFHLITHACFKALLFLGAGSVIHGCKGEQDIRFMGGLRKLMPVTFTTYTAGMLALAGFPLFFSGFWSKDGILLAARGWPVSRGPFFLGLVGVLLTAFYMARQMALVFFGRNRAAHHSNHRIEPGRNPVSAEPHESPPLMILPLAVLACFAVGLGWAGTPVWPWFQKFLEDQPPDLKHARFFEPGALRLMLLSTGMVLLGLFLGWKLYGRKPLRNPEEPDVLKRMRPDLYALVEKKYFIDEFYEATVIRFNAWAAAVCHIVDEWLLGGLMRLLACLAIGLAWVNRAVEEFVLNPGFDWGCGGTRAGGGGLSRLQDGRVQNYLRIIGLALVALVLLLIWGGGN